MTTNCWKADPFAALRDDNLTAVKRSLPGWKGVDQILFGNDSQKLGMTTQTAAKTARSLVQKWVTSEEDDGDKKGGAEGKPAGVGADVAGLHAAGEPAEALCTGGE